MVAGAKECGADRVELYTEAYARDFAAGRERAIEPYVRAAEEARRCGLGLNAGHDSIWRICAISSSGFPGRTRFRSGTR